MPKSDQVSDGVSGFVKSVPREGWNKISDEDMRFIDQAFMSMVEKDSESQTENSSDQYNKRVYEEILKMWQKNKNQMTSINTY